MKKLLAICEATLVAEERLIADGLAMVGRRFGKFRRHLKPDNCRVVVRDVLRRNKGVRAARSQGCEKSHWDGAK